MSGVSDVVIEEQRAGDVSAPVPAPASAPAPNEIGSMDEWKEKWKALKSDSHKLAVLDFTAQWCGPCRFIEPAVKELATKYGQVEFLKIDVDKLPELATKWKVRAMPTFILVKGGSSEVSRVVGAKKNELDRKIQLALPAN